MTNLIFKAILDPEDPWTAKLTTGDPNGTDGWFVEWIRLVADGMIYNCPVQGWLDNGAGANGPNTRTVECKKLGIKCPKRINMFSFFLILQIL